MHRNTLVRSADLQINDDQSNKEGLGYIISIGQRVRLLPTAIRQVPSYT